jgi:short chain dehydrogenase
MDRIDHRVAIVTGGTRGIGAAITATLARAGYHVAAGYSANQAAAEQFTGKLIADGLCLSAHQGNVGEPGDCTGHRGSALPARASGHPCQQRRHHRRQNGSPDDRQGLACRARRCQGTVAVGGESGILVCGLVRGLEPGFEYAAEEQQECGAVRVVRRGGSDRLCRDCDPLIQRVKVACPPVLHDERDPEARERRGPVRVISVPGEDGLPIAPDRVAEVGDVAGELVAEPVPFLDCPGASPGRDAGPMSGTKPQ